MWLQYDGKNSLAGARLRLRGERHVERAPEILPAAEGRITCVARPTYVTRERPSGGGLGSPWETGHLRGLCLPGTVRRACDGLMKKLKIRG
jgi:hypothetical protein